ncbi:MAG: 50S ribosomal protein L11 methyltransferase [Microscillaceae bacterium]|nr:50S ribosomal protein L11 methyltransferase [Microscillaceae bacterium]MDW8460280.1 50S ribosomal protein L11 methyltransferase [Cytophagales bacterium]
MPYTEVKIFCPVALSEILIAELAYIQYESFNESFEENNNYLYAYIPSKLYNENALREILARYQLESQITYETQTIAEQNWNAIWESNFTHLVIDNQILIKANFHQIEQTYPYAITINPKMAFGTGHHETTEMMLKNLLYLPHKPQKVLDCGTGTGILAIMAALLGATYIIGIDIDEWSYQNALENIALNGQNHIQIAQKSIFDIEPHLVFDVILANINKNVLLAEISQYAAHLSANGFLLMSGFYISDLPDIQAESEKNGLTYKSHLEKNEWVSVVFQHISK